MGRERKCGEEGYRQCDYFYGEGAHRVKFISIRPLSVSEPKEKSFEMAEVSGDSFDLWSGQTVSNRRHNRRYVRLGRVLSSLFAPIDQFAVDVVRQLARQARNLAATLGFWTVAGGAGGNVGFGETVFEYFFASRSQAPRSAAEGRRIERAKIGGKSGDHPWTQRVGDVEHDVVGSPMFDEGFQLIFQILGLLAGEARDRKVAMEALRRAPVAVFAIRQLGLDVTHDP